MRKPHFSSMRMDWKTPKAVYQVLDSEFNFDHDPCPANWDGKINGLVSSWGESNFVNPPYGRELPKWIEKGYDDCIGRVVKINASHWVDGCDWEEDIWAGVVTENEHQDNYYGIVATVIGNVNENPKLLEEK